MIFTAWYTKSMKDNSPMRLVHYSDNGDETLCGVKIDSPRWYLGKPEWSIKVTCKKCVLDFEIKNYLENT